MKQKKEAVSTTSTIRSDGMGSNDSGAEDSGGDENMTG